MKVYIMKVVRVYHFIERTCRVMNEHVFALDIGTQSVTGIILQKNGQSFEICDFYTKQHEKRAMLDGQIQNVVEVANIITEVKQNLEQKHGPLQHVCVAAAGRALKTIQANIKVPISEHPITTEEEIKHLELSAVQQAQLQLAEEKEGNFKDYHCVGYSVTHYKLDGEVIGSFIDQIGEEASVEVIATFLPKIVVDSLTAALERADLNMQALTLEPIAAIHVLVPESMRRLNVALIDIGAGTSDLAIANDGTIVAYGMVPVAGDEITEKVSDHFLLDFKQAEMLKRKVVDEKVATVEDILGFEVNVTFDQLKSIIENSVDQLAQLLAEKVKMLNKKSPQAVMLIGGGSLTPMIDEKLAHYLQLPNNRVAVRGSDAIQQIENKEAIPSGPDFVTPIGIAISATENPFQYMNVYVNDKNYFLFAMNDLTVGDCFIQAGIDLNDYYGKIGLAYFITVNGESITIPGSRGEPPKITVNGQEATVKHHVKPQDRIHIIKGEDGHSPSVTIANIVGEISNFSCYYNDEKVDIYPTYLANNKAVNEHYLIQDNDDIIVKIPETVGQFLDEVNAKSVQNAQFRIFINRKPIHLDDARSKVLLNGEEVPLTKPIKNGDHIQLVPAIEMTTKRILEKLEKQRYFKIHVSFNNEPVMLQQEIVQVKRNDQLLNDDDIISPNDQLMIKDIKQREFIFQDVFRYVDFDISQVGGNYELLCNDEKVSFHHVICDGDQLFIKSL